MHNFYISFVLLSSESQYNLVDPSNFVHNSCQHFSPHTLNYLLAVL